MFLSVLLELRQTIEKQWLNNRPLIVLEHGNNHVATPTVQVTCHAGSATSRRRKRRVTRNGQRVPLLRQGDFPTAPSSCPTDRCHRVKAPQCSAPDFKCSALDSKCCTPDSKYFASDSN